MRGPGWQYGGVRVGVDGVTVDKLRKCSPAELWTDPGGVQTTADQRKNEEKMREKFQKDML